VKNICFGDRSMQFEKKVSTSKRGKFPIWKKVSTYDSLSFHEIFQKIFFFTSGALLSKNQKRQKNFVKSPRANTFKFQIVPLCSKRRFPLYQRERVGKTYSISLKKCVLNTKVIVVIPLVLFGRHSRLYTKLIKKKRSSINYYYYIRVFFCSSSCGVPSTIFSFISVHLLLFFWCWFDEKFRLKFCSLYW